jgi:hypothetical protein
MLLRNFDALFPAQIARSPGFFYDFFLRARPQTVSGSAKPSIGGRKCQGMTSVTPKRRPKYARA